MTSDPSNHNDATTRIFDRAYELGFALVGIADASPSEWIDELRDWLAAGKQGSMQWMSEHGSIREDPARVLDNARSAIMVADLYASRVDNVDTPLRNGEGRIARYARGKDYHKILKKRLMTLADELRLLFPDDDFRVFVDTAPVLERELAMRAGLGWIGKHTLTIHPKLGSYFLLGGILSTRAFVASEDQHPISGHCGSCTRCIDACPTDAITPYSVDARKCISYLTIEHREQIDEQFHAPIGDWLYGCDICQEVCPHNSQKSSEQLSEQATAINDAYQPIRDRFDLLEVIGWTENDRREAFKGTALKRAKLEMMHRNAKIVQRNQSGD